MHLRSLALRNFRMCDDTKVSFRPDLTILAGENNSGKTAVLDGLRLLSQPSDGRRSRSPESSDLRRGTNAMDLQATYEGLSDPQRGLFYTALENHSSSVAVLGMSWEAPTGRERRRWPTYWVGPRRGPDSEIEMRDLVRHVHLPALRDANRDLASSSPGRIEFLMRHLVGGDTTKEAAMVSAAKASFDELESQELIQQASNRVQSTFRPLTEGFQPQEASLHFAAPTLVALARDLRFQLALEGFDAADLAESGLGYANLLYLASVLVELEAARDAELTLLLVEEPEAHLHPQLQTSTLRFLLKHAEDSAGRLVEPGQHAGRIQVIVTTHSPHLTAAVPPEHVVVLKSSRVHEIHTDAGDETSALRNHGGPVCRAVAVADLGLANATLRKLERYLSVTRSSLLFAGRALLVEGIAESLLMSVFAKRIFAGSPGDLARFRASSIIAIDGVDFEPYVQLLLGHGPQLEDRIGSHVVVLTDDDPNEPVELDGTQHGDDKSAGQRRRDALRGIAESLGAKGLLKVFRASVTLEATLLPTVEGPDADATYLILRKAFLTSHKRSATAWDGVIAKPRGERGEALVALFAAKRTRKGDFAQTLAHLLETDARADQFLVPRCIEKALRALVAH